MKRNLDLCYLILQKIVDSNEDCCNIYSNIGFSEKEILFNVKLLLNEKFIYGIKMIKKVIIMFDQNFYESM